MSDGHHPPIINIKGPLSAHRIVITVEGGAVQAVDFPKGAVKAVEIWDFDSDGLDAEAPDVYRNPKLQLFQRMVFRRPKLQEEAHA